MHRWMEIENASMGELFIALSYLLKCTNLQIKNCLEWYQPINQTFTGSIRWDPAIWSIKRIESWWGIQTLHPEMLQWPGEIAVLHTIWHLYTFIMSYHFFRVGTLFLPDLMFISTIFGVISYLPDFIFQQHHRCVFCWIDRPGAVCGDGIPPSRPGPITSMWNGGWIQG